MKNPPAVQRPQFNSWAGKIPWRRERLPTPVFWPGEVHGLYVHEVTKSQTQLSDCINDHGRSFSPWDRRKNY